jgi:hypothetical protein
MDADRSWRASGRPTQEETAVPRLTMDELTGWVHEFHGSEATEGALPQAVDTSWDETMVDTGLIVLRLETSGTELYLRRKIGGSPEWTVTFEAREHAAEATADQVMSLAAEVSAVGRLCAFLSERTAEHARALAG